MGKKTKNAKKNKFVVTAEEVSDNVVTEDKVVTKKAKKNKMVVTMNNNNKSELGEPKPKKAKKNKLVVMPAEITTKNNVSDIKKGKKGKKNKIIETSVDADEAELTPPKAKKVKKNKLQKPVEESSDDDGAPDASGDESEPSKIKTKIAKKKKGKQDNMSNGDVVKAPVEQNKFRQFSQGVTEEMIARYPVLNDEALADKFLAVKLTTTQKGRMRQIFRMSLQGTPDALLPDIIHSRMQIILKTPTLTETALRKLRILYSMLKTALMKPEELKKVNKVTESKDGDNKNQKVKGPKRWVVFIGNLPLGITKEKITEHFSDLADKIVDIRIPKKSKEPKSAIAYLEVTDSLHFELALSKHHTMLENRRINVLYTAQSGSKISKTEAKGKAAKLVALQKSGKLAGSVPLGQKRSARRKKMKAAQKAAEVA